MAVTARALDIDMFLARKKIEELLVDYVIFT